MRTESEKKPRKALTALGLARMKWPEEGVDIVWDAMLPGFAARRYASKLTTFMVMYRVAGDPKARVSILGTWTDRDEDSLAAFREQARLIKRDAKAGIDPKKKAAAERSAKAETQERAASETVNALLDRYIKRDVRARGLRTAGMIERTFERLIRPKLGQRSKYSLKRRDIIDLFDAIADANGNRMADLALAYLNAAFRWEERRDEDFRSPIVAGMSRLKAKETARSRILSDEELRDVWSALDTAKAPACFPNFVKVLLLTATRRGEASGMTWGEIVGDDDGVTWIIPPERSKGRIEHALPLPPDVLALLGEPKASGFVFSSDGGKSQFSGFSKAKVALDAEIAARRAKDGRPPMPAWLLHDLRRTARSLLSRDGVPADIGERVLGHVLSGVRFTYDRHSFRAEKADALQRLAQLVERIINPPTDNVTSLTKARAAS